MYHRQPLVLRLFLVIAVFLSAAATHASAWTIKVRDSGPVASSADGRMELAAAHPRREGIWGTLTLPIKEAQVEALRAHRYDKYFAIIPVLVDIDGFQRQANAKINEPGRKVAVEIDFTSWDDIKRGNTILITLPDGKTYKQSLSGSREALRSLEKSAF